MKPPIPASEAYLNALRNACAMLEVYAGYEDTAPMEIRSALKQCASDQGIPDGEPMGHFVTWAEHALGL